MPDSRTLAPGVWSLGVCSWSALLLSQPGLQKALGPGSPVWVVCLLSPVKPHSGTLSLLSGLWGVLSMLEVCLPWTGDSSIAHSWENTRARAAGLGNPLLLKVTRQRLNQEHVHTCSWPESDKLGLRREVDCLDSSHPVSPHLCPVEPLIVVSNILWDIFGKEIFTSPICPALWSPTVQLTPTSSCFLGKCSLLLFPEEQGPSATQCWPKVSCPGKAEPADSLNKTSWASHSGSGKGGETGFGHPDSCFQMFKFSLETPGKSPLQGLRQCHSPSKS